MSERSGLRLVVLQVLVVSLLATLLGRLWFLQVLVSDRYKGFADANTVRQVVTPAVRGQILDDQGRPLARNRTAMVVSVNRVVMDKEPDGGKALVTRLAGLLRKPQAELWNRTRLCGPESKIIGCWRGSPYQPIPITDQADSTAAQQILERREDFPGVNAELTAIREYPAPLGANAAHLIGYLGPVTDAELAKRSGSGAKGATDLQQTDQTGRAGLEAQYDDLLRGTPGVRKVAVDIAGKVANEVSDQPSVPGNYLVTSLDSKVQAVTEQALAEAIRNARTKGDPNKRGKTFTADSGAAVVMDVRTGRVVAMASYPDYDLKVWDNGLSAAENTALTAPSSNYPLISRATQGDFAPASTFKVVSTSAIAKAGYPLGASYDCPSSYTVGNRRISNYESEGYGVISLQRALEVSCDTVWYKIAYEQWLKDGGLGPKKPADIFITMAKAYGLGKRTGIDLPDENSGRVIDRAYKKETWAKKKTIWCARAVKEKATATTEHDRLVAAIDQENCDTYYQYRAGDAVNFAIGQGDTVVTPLQMARVYSAVANGGTLWTPQLATAELRPDGTVVRRFAPKKAGTLPVSAQTLAFLRQSLTGVTTVGTGKGPFLGFPLAAVPVASKTGTGEVAGKDSTSWFTSFAPSNAPQYAVVMMVSQGGTGSGISGPGVRKIYEALYGISGSTVTPAKAAIPGVVPPTALPRVTPDGTVIAPRSTAPAAPASPGPASTAVAATAALTVDPRASTRSRGGGVA